jgi:hypothetical protein
MRRTNIFACVIAKKREAVSSKTHKANRPPTLEDRLTREEFRGRFAAEKERLARHYCTVFGFWRNCRFPLCRREGACSGKARECLQRSVQQVPRERQFAARQTLLEASPRNLAAPEQAARAIMPGSFDDSWGGLRADDIPRGWKRSRRRAAHRNHRGGSAVKR